MRDRIERAFEAWGRFAYRRAWIVIAVMLLGAGALARHLPTLYMDTSTEGFFHEDDPVRVEYDRFRERYGQDTRILLAIRSAEVFSLPSLERLRALHRDLENEVPMLVEVTSLINARETRGVGDELIVGELLEDWPEDEAALADVKRRALANPLYINNLISADGDFTTILIEPEVYSRIGQTSDDFGGFDDSSEAAGADDDGPPQYLTGEETREIVEAVVAVVERHRAPDFEIWASGTPVMVDQLQVAMQSDMVRFTGGAVLTIALLLGALFRRVAGVVLPIVTVLLSLISTISVMAISGTPLTLPTQILPSLLLAVGVGAAVHILAIFYQARRRGDSKEDAIAHAMGHSGLAVVMTSFTTAGGLVSFVVAEMRPISHLGVFGPIGVLMAMVFTIVLLPALVSIFPMRPEKAATEGVTRSQAWLVDTGDWATRRAGWVIAGWAGLLVVATIGIAQVKTSHNPMNWFPDGHPLKEAVDIANDELDGMMFLEFLIEPGQENALHDPTLLKRFDEISRYAEGVRPREDIFVGKTISVADVVKEIHKALNENRADHYIIPDDRQLVAQELLLFENSGSDDLEDLVDSRFSEGRLTMKVPFVDALHLAPMFDQLGEQVAVILDGVEFTMTGSSMVIVHTMSSVIGTMARSYVVALAIITPLMILLIGSLRIGLLSMIPNLAPIWITLGVMGWFDLPLDVFSLMVGGIAIGLAVDDTIHFLHNFRRYYLRSGNLRDAVRETLTTTGQALLFTSLVLSSGFLLFGLSSMVNLVTFGLLTALTIITAFLADLLLAPALLAVVLGRETREASAPTEMETSR